ncbi:MAG TPA: DUF2510 domain-containing protein [Acidimicrobiales bacterium]
MTHTTTEPAVPAGWYPDPGDPGQHRYWDGAAWTVHTHPLQGPGGLAPATRRTNTRWWVIGVACVAALVVIGVVVAVVSTREDPYPSAWDPRVVDFVDFVEQERGLDFDHPVEIEMVPDDEFAASVRIDETEFDEEDLEQVSSSEAQLRAFGLIDGTTDLVDTTSAMRSAGILAYYSPEERKVYVRGTELTPAVEATLVHELVHALQDQRFDLREMEAGSPDPGAVRAIVEGDATRIENAFVAQLPASEQDAISDEHDSGYEESGLDSMPDALVAATAAPYALGEPAVGVLAARGGNSEVNQAFLKPPSADVQILDPRRLAEDPPEPVELPIVPDGAATVSSGDTYGALFWDIVLARRVGIHPALEFADAWHGDTSVTYESAAGRTCTTAAIRGTDAPTAEMMQSILEGWLAAGSQPIDEHTFARTRASERDVVELGVCDPGPDSAAPGEDNARQALALAAIRLELERQALELGQGFTAARCFGDGVASSLDASDLADEADPAAVQAKVAAVAEATGARCFSPPG